MGAGSGGQASLQLHTQDGKSRATLNIELGPPADPRPGAPVVRGAGPGSNHGPQHHLQPGHYHGPQHHLQPRQKRPRRRGPSARARDAARHTAWLQGKEQQNEAEHDKSDMDTEVLPDTETVSAQVTASSNELEKISGVETLDSDTSSDFIPQLDGPSEEKLILDNEGIEEDSMQEQESDLAHLPTADDPDRFDKFINNLDQDKIEQMSKQELNHINVKLARKAALQTETKKKKKHNKSKHVKI